MKKTLLLLLTLLISFSIIGCSKSNETKKKDNHFVFATWAAGTELAEFKEIVNRVNENAAGEYEIEVLSIPSDYYVKLSTLIAAKKSPDFFWLTQELVSKYAQMTAIADLTKQFEASETLTPDKFYSGVLNSAAYNGSYWGLPWIANPMIIYYNKTMFEEMNIPVPSATDDWTWQEFIDICKQFSGKTNKKGDTVYGTIVDGWPNIETFIWAGGGDIVSADGNTVLLDTKESLNGLGYLQQIISDGLTPSYAEAGSLGSNNVWFEKQRVAMFFGGIQDNFEKKMASMSPEDQFEIGYAPLPVSDDGTAWTFDWTASTVMAKKLEGNELAYRALEDLTKEFFKWKVAPPIQESLDNVLDIDPLKEGAMETIAYTMNNARSANYTPEWSDINNRLWYDLYVKMLSDGSFDYIKETQDIAQYARKLITERK